MAPRSERIKSDIADQVVGEFQASHCATIFNNVQLKKIFTDEELADIQELLTAMKEAGEDNTKRAAAIRRFSELATKVLKVAKTVV
jgi:hypothetical protein